MAAKPKPDDIDIRDEEDLPITMEEEDLLHNDDSEQRSERRRREWGLQFDVWLIRAAKKKRQLRLVLSCPLPETGQEAPYVLNVVPLRIDKYYIQAQLLNGDSEGAEPIWIGKTFIVGCTPIPNGKPAAELSEDEEPGKVKSKKKA